MKKILLTTAALIGLVLACNAMSITEQIIFSKTTETTPIALISERGGCSIPCNNTSYDNKKMTGVERLALKTLKNVSSFLVKEFCRLAKAENISQPKISYTGKNNSDALIMARSNLTALVR